MRWVFGFCYGVSVLMIAGFIFGCSDDDVVKPTCVACQTDGNNCVATSATEAIFCDEVRPGIESAPECRDSSNSIAGECHPKTVSTSGDPTDGQEGPYVREGVPFCTFDENQIQEIRRWQREHHRSGGINSWLTDFKTRFQEAGEGPQNCGENCRSNWTWFRGLVANSGARAQLGFANVSDDRADFIVPGDDPTMLRLPLAQFKKALKPHLGACSPGAVKGFCGPSGQHTRMIDSQAREQCVQGVAPVMTSAVGARESVNTTLNTLRTLNSLNSGVATPHLNSAIMSASTSAMTAASDSAAGSSESKNQLSKALALVASQNGAQKSSSVSSGGDVEGGSSSGFGNTSNDQSLGSLSSSSQGKNSLGTSKNLSMDYENSSSGGGSSRGSGRGLASSNPLEGLLAGLGKKNDGDGGQVGLNVSTSRFGSSSGSGSGSSQRPELSDDQMELLLKVNQGRALWDLIHRAYREKSSAFFF